MFRLITREEALRHPVFASFIHGWQREGHPDKDPYMREAGEYYDDELERRRFFSQEECDRLYAAQLQEYTALTDHIEPIEREPATAQIYQLPESDISVFPYRLGEALAQLYADLGTSVHFLLDLKIPWLSQDNDYAPVSQALAKLREWGVPEAFTGGFLAGGVDLSQLTVHLFWLIRCNASLPSCWLGFGDLPLVISICRHGNLHCSLYTQGLVPRLEAWASSLGLLPVEHCADFLADANEMGGIAGRERVG